MRGPGSGRSPARGFRGSYEDVEQCGGISTRRVKRGVVRGVEGEDRGNTPACAGIPGPMALNARSTPVYPRVCGDPHPAPRLRDPLIGLPPRVRGSQRTVRTSASPTRSTPACAGIPGKPGRAARRSRVYPRVCGDPAPCSASGITQRGLPPRVRGSQPRTSVASGLPRSTPACAGIPSFFSNPRRHSRVYPRVCGDPRWRAGRSPGSTGLPPRVRGSPCQRKGPGLVPRSTPACAGIPTERSGCTGRPSVYPRVCGDPDSRPAGGGHAKGLPPRVRGSHPLPGVVPEAARSTPACAGIPSAGSAKSSTAVVYPRVCGDPCLEVAGAVGDRGLPPRVRGSHVLGVVKVLQPGSTPACAGIPAPTYGVRVTVQVYPRVCGDPLALVW